jgi:nicotinamidase-related amidase
VTISSIDENAALVVIDLQKDIVAGPKAHPAEQIVANAARLAEAFRGQHLPVVLVNVAGGAPGRTDFDYGDDDEEDEDEDQLTEWIELVPELGAQPSDLRVTKLRWGAFTGSSLHATLQDLGVGQIVLAGINTQIGVETTARSAYELGYHVVLATDAMTSGDAEAHENTVRRIFPRLGQVGTTDDVLKLLSQRVSRVGGVTAE